MFPEVNLDSLVKQAYSYLKGTFGGQRKNALRIGKEPPLFESGPFQTSNVKRQTSNVKRQTSLSTIQNCQDSQNLHVHPDNRHHDAEGAVPRELCGSASFNALLHGIEITNEAHRRKENSNH